MVGGVIHYIMIIYTLSSHLIQHHSSSRFASSSSFDNHILRLFRFILVFLCCFLISLVLALMSDVKIFLRFMFLQDSIRLHEVFQWLQQSLMNVFYHPNYPSHNCRLRIIDCHDREGGLDLSVFTAAILESWIFAPFYIFSVNLIGQFREISNFLNFISNWQIL